MKGQRWRACSRHPKFCAEVNLLLAAPFQAHFCSPSHGLPFPGVGEVTVIPSLPYAKTGASAQGPGTVQGQSE